MVTAKNVTLSQLLQHADKLFASLNKPIHTMLITSCFLSNLMFALFDLVAITTLCPNANIANTKIRLFTAICIVRLILKRRSIGC